MKDAYKHTQTFHKMQTETANSTENKSISNFDELLDAKYGKLGTPARNKFHQQAQLFIIAEMIKEERHKAHLTQAALAEKIGTKKSYISRVERACTDIQISTLFRIFEDGFGLKLNLTIGKLASI